MYRIQDFILQDRWLKIRWVILLFFFVGFSLYARSLFGAFLADDNGQIVNNTIVQSQNVSNSFTGGTFQLGGRSVGAYYHPLTTSIYTLLYASFGPNPFFYHLIQVLLHITNAVFVFVIFKHFFKKTLSFLLALLFLIHTINTEAIVYISNLHDILFTFFGLLAFYLVLSPSTKLIKLATVHLFLLLSLLSKESGILFYFVTSAYILLFRKNRILLFMPGILITLSIYAYLRFAVARIGFENSRLLPIMDASLSQRLINIPAIIFYYIRTFIFPLNLVAFQSWIVTYPTFENFYLPLLVIVIISVFCIYLAIVIIKKSKESFYLYFFFFFWFIIGISFHLQIFPLDMTVSDRWFYFPIIGLLGIAGAVLNKIAIHSKGKLTLVVSIIAILFLALSLVTYARTLDWQDGVTLFGHDTKISENDYLLQSGYGAHLLADGRYHEAQLHLEKAVVLFPKNSFAWNNLGTVYSKTNQIDKAMSAYEKAISLDHFVTAYENLAVVKLQYDTHDKETRSLILEGLKYAPRSTTLWGTLILVDYHLGNHTDALTDAEQYYYLTGTQTAYNLYIYLKDNRQLKFSDTNRASISF